MKIEKERIWLHRDEVVDSIEVYENERLQFYSYTYKVRTNEDWCPLIRFDNWEIGPHYDKYDENGFLLTRKPCPKKTLEEVVELAKEFRKNLLIMDISAL